MSVIDPREKSIYQLVSVKGIPGVQDLSFKESYRYTGEKHLSFKEC